MSENACLRRAAVFEFVRMMAHNKVYLRCAQLANAAGTRCACTSALGLYISNQCDALGPGCTEGGLEVLRGAVYCMYRCPRSDLNQAEC